VLASNPPLEQGAQALGVDMMCTHSHSLGDMMRACVEADTYLDGPVTSAAVLFVSQSSVRACAAVCVTRQADAMRIDAHLSRTCLCPSCCLCMPSSVSRYALIPMEQPWLCAVAHMHERHQSVSLDTCPGSPVCFKLVEIPAFNCVVNVHSDVQVNMFPTWDSAAMCVSSSQSPGMHTFGTYKHGHTCARRCNKHLHVFSHANFERADGCRRTKGCITLDESCPLALSLLRNVHAHIQREIDSSKSELLPPPSHTQTAVHVVTDVHHTRTHTR
jgi:hypothetical protein